MITSSLAQVPAVVRSLRASPRQASLFSSSKPEQTTEPTASSRSLSSRHSLQNTPPSLGSTSLIISTIPPSPCRIPNSLGNNQTALSGSALILLLGANLWGSITLERRLWVDARSTTLSSRFTLRRMTGTSLRTSRETVLGPLRTCGSIGKDWRITSTSLQDRRQLRAMGSADGSTLRSLTWSSSSPTRGG